MITGKSDQEEEEYEEVEFVTRKHGPSSALNSNNSNKDTKNNDKASVIRSKHSVTEQRRRSKINERFQILRDLIPHSDQKRDTSSFLLEEKVQKYEGSYQGWSPEPTKLMPWRNSDWRVQSFVGNPQAVKDGSGPGSTFPAKLDDSHIMPARSDGVLAHPLEEPISGVQSTECPFTSDPLNQNEELTIEGGTISISSVYSQGLLNSLTQALQSAGLDLSHSRISVQINLGKRANKEVTSGSCISKNHENTPSSNQVMAHFRDAGSGEDSDQAHKRQKT
ncbi:Transcription factor BIM2 [Quillaja saponaria]|uniref:Transcription factor BIM2 n=1 Tax=Quillaja saponaria TaxID=32244 RepID=A0AAD7L990_QUISA|nr:Transcription factor BIM2 [Quillaja saponaria]